MARKAPIRTCVACGTTSDKRDMVRFVRDSEGQVSFDATGRKAGRGAYICADRACFEKAYSKHLLDARLRTKLSSNDYEGLKADYDAFMYIYEGDQKG